MSWWFWVGFNVFVLTMLMIDLGIFHRKARAVTVKEAGVWSAVWISLALIFNALVYSWWGPTKAMEFLTGYIIEYSLSVDNMFVFVMIFTYFSVPAAYQHRVLFWGILGALIMRAAFIAIGAALLAKFHWVIYIFGAFLVITGVKMGVAKNEGVEPSENPVVRLVKRLVPMTDRFEGEKFFARHAGKLLATPLFLVLVMVETTDLIFAVDSIPAIFGVTRDPFIVYTSNVFAILGLRSLYFLLAGIIHMFRYLKLGLAVVLTFVGVKMLLTSVYKMPIEISLGVVIGILGISVLASILIPPKASVSEHGRNGH